MRPFRFLIFLGSLSASFFSSVRTVAQPANDICSSANNIQSYLVQAATESATAGPFSNVAATGNDVDIATVTGCWLDDLTGLADGSSPQIDATVWFHFTGIGGEFKLEVQPCDTNLNFISEDTQMVLFSGECDSLQLVDCNEDIDAAASNYWSAIQTTLVDGASYYLAIDGFNYSGFGSPELPLTTGQFCLQVTNPALEVMETAVSKVSVFPNPNDGIASITAEEELVEVAVYDVRGALIQQWQPQHVKQYDLTLPEESGIYMVKVSTAQTSRVVRLVRR